MVIINEAFARQFGRRGIPLNERLIIGRGMREFSTTPSADIGVSATRRDGG